jgi:deoxyribose-phosphate aldolase
MKQAGMEDLIEQITDEIIRRLGLPGEAQQCACHATVVESCPDRVRFIIECGADRVGLPPGAGAAHSELAQYIDHTLLKPDATRDEIAKLCREAAEYRFAAVCVNPSYVHYAARLLRGTPVAVASVVGFPLGATLPDVKGYETRRALYDGAREIDMVINVGALKSGDDGLVKRDIEAVVAPCHEADAITKVIIETSLLTNDEKVKACLLAKEAGADFVKTSTGFSSGGATPEDVALMRRVVGRELGVKASGGIRDTETARKMIEAGATRIGASASVKIVGASPAKQPVAGNY